MVSSLITDTSGMLMPVAKMRVEDNELTNLPRRDLVAGSRRVPEADASDYD